MSIVWLAAPFNTSSNTTSIRHNRAATCEGEAATIVGTLAITT